MSIADKLSAIGRNLTRIFDVGYNKGYGKGHEEGYEEGASESGYNKGYEDGYEEGASESGYNKGYEDGKQAEYDAFWDVFQENGERNEYTNAFGGSGWTKDTFKPKYNIVVSNGYMMFRDSKIEGHLGEILSARGLVLDTSIMYSANYMFSQCRFTGLPVINLLGAPSTSNMFGSSSLVTIDKIIVAKKTSFSNDSFSSASNLANLTIEGEIGSDINFKWSTKLTRASIESIIGHLSDTATGKTLTLSKTAVDTAFPDDWDSYVTANKPGGWTITLV